jgi:hypothetical protein
MLTILEKLENQPNFPHEDLSDNNAEILCLALANKALSTATHRAAEGQYPLINGTHKPLLVASDNIYDSHDNLEAIDFGITSFEAITWYVAANHAELNPVMLQLNIVAITNSDNSNGVRNYFEQSYHDFTKQMSKTTEIIAESAQRYHRGRESLAVLGGAIALRFEMDCSGIDEGIQYF